VDPEEYGGEADDPRGGGKWEESPWYCEVCNVAVTNDVAWLDHINGRKHNRALGFSMRTKELSEAEFLQRCADDFRKMRRRRRARALRAGAAALDAAAAARKGGRASGGRAGGEEVSSEAAGELGQESGGGSSAAGGAESETGSRADAAGESEHYGDGLTDSSRTAAEWSWDMDIADT